MRLLDLTAGEPAVAMLGMCKNAGKTTALNRLIRELGEAGAASAALTSIGRDGEARDLVTGTDKPPIYMREGMLAATAEQLLSLCDVSREILSATGLYTSLGEVILFRARSDGFVQLAGPGIVAHMKRLRGEFARFGASPVLIDGALSRLSLLAGASDGVCVLSTGASLDRNPDRVVAETAYVAALLGLPEKAAPGAPRGKLTLFGAEPEGRPVTDLARIGRAEPEETLLSEGAFTETQARALLRGYTKKEGLTLLVRDASCLMLKRETYEALAARGMDFAVRQGTRLAAVTVNSVSAGGWRFDGDEFREKMQAAVNVPVLDVKK
ncbi:MAG: hypothetical protein IJK86_02820 [Lachnospiraceae bacterium]|nr:hypothetical protein [Lachnospiraceae bacterium]